MSDQSVNPVPVQMNGGVFPDENGSWRVVVWFHGIRSETEAHRISGWLNGLLQAHISRDQPNPEPPHHDSNGAAPPRPDPVSAVREVMRLDPEMSKHWFGLPLHLRKRWWDETEYGKKPPSEELKQAVKEAIEEKTNASGRSTT